MWSNFENSQLEDETISNNFASRGMFKMRPEEAVKEQPSVQASIQDKHMLVAIDKSLVLVEEEMESKCCFLSFNANIDAFAISQSGNLIICGLSNGEIHGIFIKGVPLFNLCIKIEDTPKAGKAFTAIQEIDKKFHLICTNGSVYRICEIDEQPLLQQSDTILCGNETIVFDESIFEYIKLENLSSNRKLDGISAALLMPSVDIFENQCSTKLTLIAGNDRTVFLNNINSKEVTRLNLPEAYKGVKRLVNVDYYILLLTNSGHLLEICPITRLISLTPISNEILIDDLIIMESSEENIELLILTKEIEKTGGDHTDSGRFMKFVQFPSFKCLNEFEVAMHAWIVQQPKCAVNLYFLRSTHFNENHFSNEIEMMSVSETHPSERFKKLIAKGHFEEAENYGLHFELCLQPIYEAKAKQILVKLCNLDENNPEILYEHFDQLLKLLEKIENRDFFKNNRTINIPSRTILKRFLNELLKRLDEEHDESDILEIHEQLRRLETLNIIDYYECNREWQKFVYSSNLVKYLIKQLKNDIPIACFIFKRHSASIITFLEQKEVRKLFSYIPNNTEAFNLIQWLRQFVPIISNTHPEIMGFITQWGIEKTRSLQYSEHWPEIGLEFSTKVLEIMEEVEFMHFDVRRQNEQNIAKLRDLVNALQDLSVLKTSYNLIFTLDNYQQESLYETAFRILQRVNLTHLKNLVNDFLYPIFQEQGQTPVSALKRYITLMVSSRHALSQWLDRSIACIELLHNEDDKMETALAVLQYAPVPWSDTVNPIVKLRFSTHPLASKINAEYEMQAIKAMRAKYGWPTDSAGSMQLNLFMFCIVKHDLPDMFDDIRLLTQAAPEIAQGANFNCCYQTVRRGKSEAAYDFFKTLNTKSQTNVIQLFVEILENGVMHKDSTFFEEQKQLIEFLKLITKKNFSSYQRRLQAIESRFILFKYFGKNTDSVSLLVPLEKRLEFLESGIDYIINKSHGIFETKEINIIKYFMNEIVELTNALQLHKIKGIRILCRRLKCLQMTCAFAYAVLDTDDCNTENNEDYINLALDLLAQQIIADKINQTLSPTVASISIDNDTLTYPLIYELLVRAKLHERKYLIQLLDFLKYIKIVNLCYPLKAINNYYENRTDEINEMILKFLNSTGKRKSSEESIDVSFNVSMPSTNEVKPTKKRESVSVFDEIEVEPKKPKKVAFSTDEYTISKFVTRTILVLVLTEGVKNHFFKKLRALLLAEDETLNFSDASQNFFSSFEQLVKIKEHNIWYTMAQYIMDFQQQNDCKIIADELVTLQLIRVFRSLMMQPECNFIDIFTMLIADNHTEILLQKLERDIRTDQQKYNFLTLIQMYNVFRGEEETVEAVRFSRLKHFYYMEFCKQDSTIKGKFNIEIDNIEKLLKEFRNKQLDVQLLERISRDFDLDLDHILIMQVITILQNQEMQYEVKTDSFGEEEFVMITTVEQIRKLCKPYIDKIKNTEILASKLKQFLSEINDYFYELYLCVIEILSFIGFIPPEMQIWTSILQFLKHKLIRRRRNRPGQVETDLWLQSRSEIGVLPKIAKYRLPFKGIVEKPLKDILDNEIAVDNCESWFPLIEMHTTLKGSNEIDKQRDYYCMVAVKNSIDNYKVKNDIQEVWHIQPTNNAFLKSILRLVEHVKKPPKRFLILYYVSNNAPEGADQVEATYECYKYGLANQDEIIEKHEEQFKKLKRKYPILKTQHLLYEYGLTDEKLLHLVENPQELIFNLYHHELILKPSKLDINAVIKQIAELHDINLGVMQFQLLQKWLSCANDVADGTVMEETLLEDQHFVNQANENALENADECVLRATYILSSWPKEEATQFLIAHIFPSDRTSNTTKQLQMYECLSKLDDGSDAVKNMLNQRKYITIKCVHELKQLGYNSSVEKFSNCNKIDILKTIWKHNAQNPHTLEILANICLGYDIYLCRIWNGILKRMALFHMVRELNALVDALSCKRELLHIEGLLIAWDYVLKHPFKNANQTRSFEQEEILHKTLFRIQSCPVLEKLNLLEFATLCIGLERPHMAAVLMILTKCEKQRKEIKELIIPRKSEKLRKEILELEDAGILRTIINQTLKELEL